MWGVSRRHRIGEISDRNGGARQRLVRYLHAWAEEQGLVGNQGLRRAATWAKGDQDNAGGSDFLEFHDGSGHGYDCQ